MPKLKTRTILISILAALIIAPALAPATAEAGDKPRIREVSILPVVNKTNEDFSAFTLETTREYFMNKGATLVSTGDIKIHLDANKPENKKQTRLEQINLVRSKFKRGDMLVVVTIESIARKSKKLGVEKRNKVELTGEVWLRTGDEPIFRTTKTADNKEKSIAGIKTKEDRTIVSRQHAIRDCIPKLFDDFLQGYELKTD
jgi:hypothetical protein